jgi:hypothetical protein
MVALMWVIARWIQDVAGITFEVLPVMYGVDIIEKIAISAGPADGEPVVRQPLSARRY